MTLISKTAGALSLSSCIIDMHKCGKLYANKSKAKASANGVIRRSISSQMIDELSYKDAQIKNWAGSSQTFLGVQEFFASVKGYTKGFLQSGVKYIPNFTLATIALLSRSKNHALPNTIANLASVALGLIHGGHFIKVATGFGEKNDFLE